MKGKNAMLRNKELHDFLCERNAGLTEQWYESLDKNQGGIYGSINPNIIEKLKQQNIEFHNRFCSMFIKEYEEFLEDFQDWIVRTARDEDRLSTPTTAVLQDFFQTQKQYLQLVEEFASIQGDRVSKEQLIAWNQGITATINDLLLEFTTQTAIAAEKKLNAQQELIVEMSAPVILLTKDTGLLPLVGEISTYRAQIMFEKALQQSTEYHLERLFIDLSGVPIIDTMVAHQIFQLIDGLRIIGVKTALAGISPDIAQTAIQLGINFREIEVYNTLAQAMKLKNLEIQGR
ncbi:rsbT co-antagonist protein RsbR [Chryseomicrobium aureum]|uniref:STAS domain-containing protein n=1 Tax=Chryseomicrobium aureum TaxID=1441723 RepID=UPI001EF96759|nr:STAS domain-containing protein [Chryseomicrobium aureum]MBM7707641.1 rsbT co-antagonist protein RsbR [Chryseomicrobium aureum]